MKKLLLGLTILFSTQSYADLDWDLKVEPDFTLIHQYERNLHFATSTIETEETREESVQFNIEILAELEMRYETNLKLLSNMDASTEVEYDTIARDNELLEYFFSEYNIVLK